jgi:8-oxo-dGTP pyrophosphatase MutT (NUDIX family)
MGTPGTVDDPIPRRAGRVILVDAEDRVLLLRMFDPARPDFRYWVTVGGGLDAGETPAQAAARELREETGLVVSAADLGDSIWRHTTEFPFDNRWYRQEQDFFGLRVESWTISAETTAALVEESVDEHRWWSVAELAATPDRYYPDELVDLLNGILES